MSLPIAEGLRQRRDALLIGGLLALVLAGLAGLAAATGWEETWAALARLGPAELAVLLLLSLANYGFRGIRWHVFAGRLGLETTLGQNFRHFIGGFAMSVTPGRVGELVRMRWIQRETGWSFARTAPLVLVDRAADLAAMAAILGIALAFSTTGIAGGLPAVALAFLVAWLATRPEIVDWAARTGYRLTGRAGRLFVRVRHAARSLTAFRPIWALLPAALVGILGWAAEGWAFHLLLGWLGAEVSLSTAVAIFIFATLAGGVTGAPGGLGGAEAAMVALLMLEGVPPEISIPATLIIRVTTLWFAIFLGLLVFPLAERRSLKA